MQSEEGGWGWREREGKVGMGGWGSRHMALGMLTCSRGQGNDVC